MTKIIFYIFVSVLLSSCANSNKPIISKTISSPSFFQKSLALDGFKGDPKSSRLPDIQFSPDGKLLAAYLALDTNRATIKIWDAHSGNLKYTTNVGGSEGYDDLTAQTHINFLPDSNSLILDGQIGPMVLWNFTNSTETKKLCAGEYTKFISISEDRQFIHMQTLPGSDYLCSASDNTVYFAGRFGDATVVLTPSNKLRAIFPSTFKPSHRKGDPFGTKIPRQLVDDNNYLTLQESMKYIDIWEHKGFGSFSRNNQQYQVWNREKQLLSMWNYSTKQLVWEKHLINPFSSSSHLDTRKVSILNKEKLTMLDSLSGKELWQKLNVPQIKTKTYYPDIKYSPDGKRIRIKKPNGLIEVFNSTNGKQISSYRIPKKNKPNSRNDYSLDPHGNFIYRAVDNKQLSEAQIEFIDPVTKSKKIIKGSIYSISFSPNGGKVAFSSNNANQIWIWETGF